MTDPELIVAREEYFEQYRLLCEQQEQISQAIDEENHRHHECINQLDALSTSHQHNIVFMRKVITKMLELGCDPVEAKLKLDDNYKNNIWDRYPSHGFTGTVTASIPNSIPTITATSNTSLITNLKSIITTKT